MQNYVKENDRLYKKEAQFPLRGWGDLLRSARQAGISKAGAEMGRERKGAELE